MKSYLRWVGSKSRIIDNVVEKIGKVSGRLIEPFVGSATVAINADAKEYICYDINERLIKTHQAICKNVDKVLLELRVLLNCGRDDYYKIRAEFNTPQTDIYKLAAMFIYLNRTGFNGLYRENKSGGYNTPMGSGNIKQNVDELIQFSKKFNSSDFVCGDFTKAFKAAKVGDVIYVDPPYPSTSETLSDVKYHQGNFGIKEHIKLHSECIKAAKRGIKVVVSNANTIMIRELYADADEIEEILAYRSISSTNNRANAKELIITYRG